jgi:hypothetical protein
MLRLTARITLRPITERTLISYALMRRALR